MKCPECNKKCLEIYYYSDNIKLKYPNLIGQAIHKKDESLFKNFVILSCKLTKDYRIKGA